MEFLKNTDIGEAPSVSSFIVLRLWSLMRVLVLFPGCYGRLEEALPQAPYQGNIPSVSAIMS
jgi:hypothetical protein